MYTYNATLRDICYNLRQLRYQRQIKGSFIRREAITKRIIPTIYLYLNTARLLGTAEEYKRVIPLVELQIENRRVVILRKTEA
jgi:hypothetical protein